MGVSQLLVDELASVHIRMASSLPLVEHELDVVGNVPISGSANDRRPLGIVQLVCEPVVESLERDALVNASVDLVPQVAAELTNHLIGPRDGVYHNYTHGLADLFPIACPPQ